MFHPVQHHIGTFLRCCQDLRPDTCQLRLPSSISVKGRSREGWVVITLEWSGEGKGEGDLREDGRLPMWRVAFYPRCIAPRGNPHQRWVSDLLDLMHADFPLTLHVVDPTTTNDWQGYLWGKQAGHVVAWPEEAAWDAGTWFMRNAECEVDSRLVCMLHADVLRCGPALGFPAPYDPAVPC